jgi:hypothetical protein
MANDLYPVTVENLTNVSLLLRVKGVFMRLTAKQIITVDHLEYLGADCIKYALDNRISVRRADRRFFDWKPVKFFAGSGEPVYPVMAINAQSGAASAPATLSAHRFHDLSIYAHSSDAASDATLDVVSPALADPAKWVGAWITDSLSAPNIITGAPGGTLSTESGSGLITLGDGNTSVGRSVDSPAAGHVATVNVGITDFTLGAFMRADSPDMYGSSPYLVMGDAGFTTNYFLMHTWLESLQVSGTYGTPVPLSIAGMWIRDGQFRHYAFVYTSADHRLLCYRDGVVTHDLDTTYDLFGGVVPAKFGLALQPSCKGWLKNPFLTREALSPAAVAALAAGRLPASDGTLV